MILQVKVLQKFWILWTEFSWILSNQSEEIEVLESPSKYLIQLFRVLTEGWKSAFISLLSLRRRALQPTSAIHKSTFMASKLWARWGSSSIHRLCWSCSTLQGKQKGKKKKGKGTRFTQQRDKNENELPIEWWVYSAGKKEFEALAPLRRLFYIFVWWTLYLTSQDFHHSNTKPVTCQSDYQISKPTFFGYYLWFP